MLVCIKLNKAFPSHLWIPEIRSFHKKNQILELLKSIYEHVKKFMATIAFNLY